MNYQDILYNCARKGNAELLQALLPYTDAMAWDSWALRLAAGNGYAECVRILLSHSDAMARDSWALRLAAEYGHAECVELLWPHSCDKGKAIARECGYDYDEVSQ